MRGFFSAAVLCLLVAMGAVFAVPASHSGTGFGDSAAAAIDTRLPIVDVTDPPEHTVLQGGQSITLNWSLSDDNPTGVPGANEAQMWIGDILWETLPGNSGSGSFDWQWTAPDTSSGTVHLVVRSADAYGNLTVAASADFTILSTATDVPETRIEPVFAAPWPNPFNPLTRLRFHLPEAGPVRVTVHDARGFLVAELHRGHQSAAPLDLVWNGTDGRGRRQAGGAYFFRLDYREQGQARQIVRKAVLLP